MNSNILLELIRQDEGPNLEFKEEVNLGDKFAMADFLRHLLSLANSLGGPAYLVIGVRDKTREIVGLQEEHPLSDERLQQIVGDYCTPSLTFSFKKIKINDKLLGVIAIPPSSFKPHRLRQEIAGRYPNGKEWKIPRDQVYTRRGSITSIASPEEIVQMNEEAKSIKFPPRIEPPPSESVVTEKAPVAITFSPLPISREFFGRKDELQSLVEELSRSPVVLVEGLAGIGKTSLVARYLNQENDLRSKAFWLECQEGTNLNSIMAAFSDFARRNNNSEMAMAVLESYSIHDRLHGLVRILEDTSCILCLDHFESADDISVVPLVEEFLDHCNRAKLIICTRERPRSFFSLFADVAQITLRGLEMRDAVTMLNRYLTHQNNAIYKQVAERTDGHPFAIKLFVALVGRYGLSPRELLNTSPMFGKTLEEYWLSKIFSVLSNEERNLLERFSVYIESVPREAIQYISLDQDWTAHLYSLQDKFLITQEADWHFSTHLLIRDFCNQKLAERGVLQETARLAASYYLNKYTLEDHPRNMGQEEVSEKLKAHHYLMMAQEFDLGAKVVHNIQQTLMKWAQYSLLMGLLETSLKTASTYNPRFDYYRGRILYIQGKLEASYAIFKRLTTFADNDLVCNSIQQIANIYLQQKRTDDVIHLFETNLAVFHGHPKSQQDMLDKIGRVYIEKGNFEQAIEIYKQILHWQEAEKNTFSMGITMRQLAEIYLAKGEIENAKNLCYLSRNIAKEFNNQRLLGKIESTLGEIHEKANEIEEALDHYHKSLEIATTIDNRLEIVTVATHLRRLYEAQHQAEQVDRLAQLIKQTETKMNYEGLDLEEVMDIDYPYILDR